MGNIQRKDIMQYVVYCIALLGLYFGISWSGEATDHKSTGELAKIIEVMDKHEIELTDWTLYTREHLNSWKTEGEYEEEFRLLKENTPEFTWEPLANDELRGQKKAVATRTYHDTRVTETLTYIVYPHNEQLHSYLIYNVHGEKKVTEDQWQTLDWIIQNRLEDLFQNNTKIFTCVSGNSSDKLNFGFKKQADALLADFSAQTIESLKEETFISISAYTNIWNNSLTTNNQNMNLQVAIRATQGLGGKTTVTIGTPIITTEY
ncbi:hypothetical protein DS745_04850 [Anaerobacillus alkaliphilus]|uniref:YwmB family TATA-box binding protein n=1 Tax=Anaerobacillus alkaliphilus TaxID=1548597 RepID=A0A4Q0VWG0_9BACI|nr:YwmB family TATA-box binding protein [Anaerobacillus alkaliphilus]RXJ02916.1 hypothetical protein DS745_04850 [Anaerobacillus alkaliphilus]